MNYQLTNVPHNGSGGISLVTPLGPKGHLNFNKRGHLKLHFTLLTTLIPKFPVRTPSIYLHPNLLGMQLTNGSLWNLIDQIINSNLSSTLFPSPHPSCFCNCSIHRDNSSFCHFLCSNSSCNSLISFSLYSLQWHPASKHIYNILHIIPFSSPFFSFSLMQFNCSSIFTPIMPIFGCSILKKSWRRSYSMPVIESATLLTVAILSQEKSQRSLRWI